MTRLVKKGSTNVSVELFIIDSTDGTPETAVVWNTAGIDLNYRRDGAVVTSITEATLSALTDAHSDGGFLHVSNGRYRLDVPDAAFAVGVSQVTVGGTVTGMVVLPVTIQLVDFDPDDSVRMGMTSLPNAVADAAGGLPISDAGGLDMDGLAASVFTTQITESYNADGVAPTPAQALYFIQQMLSEMAISGKTMTIKKLDGSTTAFTLTLNSATTPTSITRAT